MTEFGTGLPRRRSGTDEVRVGDDGLQVGITLALLRPHEVMKIGRCLSDGGLTCRAYPPPRPTVDTGSESGKTSEGVASLADYFHNNHPCPLRSAPQGMKMGCAGWRLLRAVRAEALSVVGGLPSQIPPLRSESLWPC